VKSFFPFPTRRPSSPRGNHALSKFWSSAPCGLQEATIVGPQMGSFSLLERCLFRFFFFQQPTAMSLVEFATVGPHTARTGSPPRSAPLVTCSSLALPCSGLELPLSSGLLSVLQHSEAPGDTSEDVLFFFPPALLESGPLFFRHTVFPVALFFVGHLPWYRLTLGLLAEREHSAALECFLPYFSSWVPFYSVLFLLTMYVTGGSSLPLLL